MTETERLRIEYVAYVKEWNDNSIQFDSYNVWKDARPTD